MRHETGLARPRTEQRELEHAARTCHVGDVLGGTYRITRRIGAGGMADVYEVEHLRLGSRFAAKVLRKERADPMMLRRFLREARLVASLKSDHIVRVFDVSEADADPPFYVMELLLGGDLRQLLRGHARLSLERAVKIVRDACMGIDVVHAAGIVHRDLKPENLFVTHRDTGEEVSVLLDFGVVKADGGSSTQHGALIGTLKYMAPEQVELAGTVGPRADVRSLGAILYECLAGRPPHLAESLERLLFEILNTDVTPLRSWRPELPAALDAVVLRALERDPARRFPSASAFAEALGAFAGSRSLDCGSSEPTADSASTEVSLPASPRRLRWLGAPFAVGALFGGGLALGVSQIPRHAGVEVARASAAEVARKSAPAEQSSTVSTLVPTLNQEATPQDGSFVDCRSVDNGASELSLSEPSTDPNSKTAADRTSRAAVSSKPALRRTSHLPKEELRGRLEAASDLDAHAGAPVMQIETKNPYER